MTQANSFPCAGCGTIIPEEAGSTPDGYLCEECYDKVVKAIENYEDLQERRNGDYHGCEVVPDTLNLESDDTGKWMIVCDVEALETNKTTIYHYCEYPLKKLLSHDQKALS